MTIYALLALAIGTPLDAQRAPLGVERDSARAAADSMGARLRRAEQAIAILQQQLAEQAAQAVTTKSRMHLELTGRVLVHASANDHRVNNADNPQFARPDSAGLTATPFVMSARQSTIGAKLSATDILGAHFTGDVDVDFYGGQQASSGGRTFPLIRMRTARATVRWPDAEVMVGQESPLVSGLDPVSPSSIGTPDFAAAGNLWLWLPQVRVTVETPGAVRFGVQGAVLSNITGDAVGLFDTDVDAAERSGRPALEGRARVRWGEDERASEIGCGGHLGWLDVPSAARVQTHAAMCDARLSLTSQIDVRGEAYDGQGLRGLGGGGIGQNLDRFSLPLHDRGGWAQLNIDATSLVKLGGGCGVDMPAEGDVAASGRFRNQSCAGYSIIRPSGPLFIGGEVRRIDTKYTTGSVSNFHFSLAMGFEF